MIARRRLIKLSAAAALASSVGCPAVAQAGWPNRPVRIPIPFTPGGGADTIARLVALKMTEVLGQQFLVESKPGAGGNIAAEFTARSAPDGYTCVSPAITTRPIPSSTPISYHPLLTEPYRCRAHPVAMAVPD
jgi:tripartite-type tricarboxylate transporter receptor subunit TctC